MSDRPLIHLYWEGEQTPQNKWVANTIQTTHLGCSIVQWHPDNLPSFIPHIDLGYLRDEEQARHRSNVIRYILLYEMGGLWLDYDVVPLRNLFELREDSWTAAISQHREGCVLKFSPKHSYLKKVIELATQTKDVTAPLSSGAKILNLVNDTTVGKEQSVLPFDSYGHRLNKRQNVSAVHLWTTSGAKKFSQE